MMTINLIKERTPHAFRSCIGAPSSHESLVGDSDFLMPGDKTPWKRWVIAYGMSFSRLT